MFYKGYGNELGLLGHNYPKMSHKSRNIPIHMLMLKYKMLCVMTICR